MTNIIIKIFPHQLNIYKLRLSFCQIYLYLLFDLLLITQKSNLNGGGQKRLY